MHLASRFLQEPISRQWTGFKKQSLYVLMHSRCYFLPLDTRYLSDLLSRSHFSMTLSLKRIYQVIHCMNAACLPVLRKVDTMKSKNSEFKSVKGVFSISGIKELVRSWFQMHIFPLFLILQLIIGTIRTQKLRPIIIINSEPN